MRAGGALQGSTRKPAGAQQCVEQQSAPEAEHSEPL